MLRISAFAALVAVSILGAAVWTGSCSSTVEPTDGGCPDGYRMVNGRCIPKDGGYTPPDGSTDASPDDAGDAGFDAGFDAGMVICDPGVKKCVSTDLLICNDQGTAWELNDDCSERCDSSRCITGCTKDGCTSKPVICNPLDTQCCDDVEHKNPPCTGCLKDDLCQCDYKGISWSVINACTPLPDYCHINNCNTPIPLCTAGEWKCSGQTRLQCNPQGSAWVKIDDCLGCCKISGGSAICTEGAGTDASKCKDDCDCKSGFVCVGWTIDKSLVCRKKCSPVLQNCPSGYTCTSGYYCVPE
jgi:hypothetical protein